MADKKECMTEDKQFGIDSLTPPETVDYFIYRLETGRWKRAATYWMVAAFVVFVALVITNGYWIWRDSQYVDEVITVTQENTDGYNNYVGNDGDISNGEK